MLTRRAKGVQPSVTLAMTAKAKKMKEDGIDIVSFGAGEPDFNTPDYIIKMAKKAMDMGFTKYTASGGIMPLKQMICAKLKNDNNLDYSPNQIVVSNGAKHSLYNAMQALVEEGDEVIIPAPYWVTYPELVKLCGGVAKIIETHKKDDFKLTVNQLKSAITQKTKAVILNSPNNPTGAVYTYEELKALGEVIHDSGIFVISDEVYEKLIYDGQRHYSILNCCPDLYKKTIVINAVSKTYSMTGWRIGYLAADREIASAIDDMQSHMTSNANSIAQYAALAALGGGEEFLADMVKVFDTRRKYMMERLNAIEQLSYIEPKGAFYVFLDVTKLYGKTAGEFKLNSALDICQALLEVVNLNTIPGEAFGANGFLRLSYAVSMDDIKEGIDRIERFIKLCK